MSDKKFEQLNLHHVASLIDPGLNDFEGEVLPRPFTKNQMRKWLKRIRWENRKATKRAEEKKKAKERRIEAKINSIDIGPSRKSLKKRRMDESICSTGLIIDLAFDHLMMEKDRAKVIKQILRCYSLNRRSASPLQFYICSFNGRTKTEMSRHNGYQHWDVKFFEETYLGILPKEKLVYLTSESDNVIENFEANTFYIIGGLVDHNSHKGLCHQIAKEQLIKHARLPLDKYVNMKSRKVLTINQVFEIVLKICEGASWSDTLKQVLPMRKGAQFMQNSSPITSDNESQQENGVQKELEIVNEINTALEGNKTDM